MDADPPPLTGGKVYNDIYTPPSPGNFVTVTSDDIKDDVASVNICKRARKRDIDSSQSSVNNSDSGMDGQVSQKGQSIPPTKSSTDSVSRSQITPVGRLDYGLMDNGPFVVHVQRIESNPSSGSILHPISFGRFLQKYSIKNIVDGSIKKIGRNRIALCFTNGSHANSFKDNDILTSNGYKSFIPSFSVTKMGLVRGIPSEWTPEEILESIKVPDQSCPILKARRLNYRTVVDGKIEWKPSQTVVLTFDGQSLPSKIFLCYNSLPIELYIFPTIQCFQCCRFGHTKIQCRSKPRCYKCGENHTGDLCSISEDAANCLSCSGRHFATNKLVCPEFSRQKAIKTSMAEKAISYAEASNLHGPVSRSFSDVLKSSSSSNTREYNRGVLNLSTSHKKTVFSKPRSPPKSSKGYDRAIHMEMTSPVISHSPNGCTFVNKCDNGPTEISITEFLTSLLTLLSQSQNFSPSNAALIISTITNLLNHGSNTEHPSMELSERQIRQ